ncbi:DUF5677 domain-containing protein [Paenibacillus taichungensis]
MRYNDNIVSRSIDNRKLDALLHNTGNMIDEIVNFGSILIEKIGTKHEFTEIHAPFYTLFVQFLSLIDGASVVIRKGHSDALKPIARSVLEISLNLQYMILEDFNEKCLAYQVTEVRGRIKQYRRYIDDSKNGNELRALFNKRQINIGEIDYQSRITNLENMLKKDPYLNMDELYEATKKSWKNLQWYTVIDISLKSFRDLTIFLDKELYYEVVYKEFSNYSHGGSAMRRMAVVDGQSAVLPHIRDVDNIINPSIFLVHLILETITAVIESFLPEEMEYYNKWEQRYISSDLSKLSRAQIKTSYTIK